jgi:uridine kinase
MSTVLAVGLAGGTGAGKTSLCHLLARTLNPVTILDLDSYYLDRSGLSLEARRRMNFDEPGAFDLSLLVGHVRELRNGRTIQKPCYSFEHHVRYGSSSVAPAPIILVEGLFTFWWEELRLLLDLKVFVDAPEPTRFARRLERDVATRGRTRESVLEQFQATVRPMHTRYVEPTRLLADLVVVNDRDLAGCAAVVQAALQSIEPAA